MLAVRKRNHKIAQRTSFMKQEHYKHVLVSNQTRKQPHILYGKVFRMKPVNRLLLVASTN